MHQPFRIREILKNPEVPQLSERAIDKLTQLCFRVDDPMQQCDLIFIFSTSVYEQPLAQMITEYLEAQITNKVFLTGGPVAYADVTFNKLTECDLVLQHISTENFPDVEFLTERSSTNTNENITEELKAYDFSQLEKVMFIFKSRAAGRGYLTLRRLLPRTQLLQKTFNVRYPEAKSDEELTRDNWYKSQFGRERVWGEYLRNLKYGEKKFGFD